MNYTIEQINEAFDKMPPELAQAISGINLNQKTQEIGKKFGLHIDIMGQLSGLINLVLVGLERAEGFAEKISPIVKLPEDQKNQLIKEINEGIFEAVRKKYQLASQTEEEAPTEEVPAESVKTMEQVRPAIKSPEEILKTSGIEVLNGAQSSTSKLTQDKMTAPFRLPKQETDLTLTKTVPDQKDLPSPGVTPKLDPYREKPL